MQMMHLFEEDTDLITMERDPALNTELPDAMAMDPMEYLIRLEELHELHAKTERA